MADSTSSKIIRYVADIGDVVNKLGQIDGLNKKIAGNISGKLTTEFTKVGEGISKTSQQFTKFNDATKQFDGVGKQVIQSTAFIKDQDGALSKLTETYQTSEKGVKTMVASQTDLTNAQAKSLGLINPLIGKSSQLATNFDHVADVNKKFATELTGVGKAAYIVKGGLASASGDTKRFSTIVATADGRILQLNETVKKTPDGIQKVSRSVKDLTDQYNKQGKPIKDLSSNTISLGDNIARLAKRAVLTIPLWIALRAVMLGIPRAMGEGVKGIIEFDRALQKIKRNLQGSTQEINSNLASISSEITKLSLITGTSTTEIADAIKKFATIGFNTEEALAGGIGATKLSILLFGEAGETANAFARALKLLIDRSDGAKSATEQMNEAFALTAELEKTNQFELDEVTAGLENFASTAKIANLSMQETLVLLSTLGTAATGGAQGGTRLRTSFGKLVENLDLVQSQLGVKVNPQLDTTFSVLMKVIDAITKLDQKSLIAVETTGALAEVFGGVRGSLPIAALVALHDQLKANLEVTPDIAKFNKAVAEVLESEAKSADRLKNNMTELKKAFIESLVGGEKLHDIIKGLADSTGESVDEVKALADAIRNLAAALLLLSSPALIKGAVGLGAKLMGGIHVGLAASSIEKFLLAQVIKSYASMGPAGLALGATFGKAITLGIASGLSIGAIIGTLVLALENTVLDIKWRQINVDNEQINNAADQIIKGIKGQLAKAELRELLVNIQKGKVKVDKQTLDSLFNQVDKILADEAKGRETTVQADAGVAVKENAKEINEIEELIISNQLEQIRNQGALESSALKLEQSLYRQYDIEQDAVSILKKQLDLEKERSKEKRLQSKLGSDSIKLFNIAKTSGTDVAKKIGDVLSGEVDFSAFIRKGGEAVDIFKKEFADKFEAVQAEQFFKGERVSGEKGLRGGEGITIAEEAIRGVSKLGVATDIRDATKQFEKIKADLLPKAQDKNVNALNENTKALNGLAMQWHTPIDVNVLDALGKKAVPGDQSIVDELVANNKRAANILNAKFEAARGVTDGSIDLRTNNEAQMKSLADKLDSILQQSNLSSSQQSNFPINQRQQALIDMEKQFRAEKNIQTPSVASYIPTTLPAEARGNQIQFSSGAFNINIASSVSKEEAEKLINQSFVKMGTPGTKENKQIKVILNGKQQTDARL